MSESNWKPRLTWRKHGSPWWPCHASKAYKEGIDLEDGKTGYDNIKWDKDEEE